MEYSQTKDGTLCPCISRQILNHWTTREVPRSLELLHPLLWLLENWLLLQQVLQGVGLRGRGAPSEDGSVAC